MKLTLETIALDKITLHLLSWTHQWDTAGWWHWDRGVGSEGVSPASIHT